MKPVGPKDDAARQQGKDEEQEKAAAAAEARESTPKAEAVLEPVKGCRE